MTSKHILLTAALCAATLAPSRATTTADSLTMAVGCYTAQGGVGVSTYRLDPATGHARLLHTAAVSNASWVLPVPEQSLMLAVTEEADSSGSAVNSLRLDATTGAIEPLSRVSSCGAAPCHLMMPSPHTAVVANYVGGSLAVIDIDSATGALRPAAQVLRFTAHGSTERQATSHMHFSTLTPDGRFLVASNLGGDRLHVMRVMRLEGGISRLAQMGEVLLPQGCGPRHITFSADGAMCYVITELSDEVLALRYDGQGHFRLVQRVTAASQPAHGSAHIAIEGNYLYASVRLVADGIAIFRIGDDGLLTRVGYQPTGAHPRNFAITPDGSLLLCACRDTGAIELYRRDAATGLLSPLPHKIELSQPVCIQWLTD